MTDSHETRMTAQSRRFHLQRDRDVSGVSGTGVVALGVLWPDGTASVRWLGDRPSIVFWDDMADAEAVHGHGGATRVVWDDATDEDELQRLRDRNAELEAWAHGCDGEGCTLPHSSWCDGAKAYAAEHNGCTCGLPWANTPQPHAGHCWLVSPPRDEVEQMRRALAERPAPADRAAVLREAASRYEAMLARAATEQDPRYWTAVRDITLGLRRLADDAEGNTSCSTP
ncbi:hypothetical protein OG897_06320 [Streptomyces sp. NBC_00237]|uniref:hypothetical protein n=1 Tax=Streptomyces sp. NBC_00237 TaxID=2975687 RepID=UPI0022577F27|nr:hypothetical protein [Streptomyces sp. NBC_00237]MCX5201077.1 hypothetical protein [Streptomyces sp. NBC_00237]